MSPDNENNGSISESTSEPVLAPVFNDRCACTQPEILIAQGSHEEEDGNITTYAAYRCPNCNEEYVVNTNGQKIPDPEPPPSQSHVLLTPEGENEEVQS